MKPVRRLAVICAIALAAPPAALADGPSLGAAVASFNGVVTMRPAYRGALNPGRAATILARQVRARGDDPQLVACTMTSYRSTHCALVVVRGGARWTGYGAVWQGKRHFVTSYAISGS